MRKFRLLISATAVFFFIIAFKPTLAQTESAQPETTPTVDPQIKQKVEQRIQDVLTAQTNQKKAFIGEITEINSVIAIKTDQGLKQIRTDDEKITVVGLKRENLETDDLEIDHYVIAMGYLGTDDVLDAKRIVITAKPKTSFKAVAFGQVTDKSSDGENILTLKHLKENKTYDIEITKKTTITKSIDGKDEEIEFDEINSKDKLVVIGEKEDDNGFITAETIRVVSFQTTPQQETNESPSSTTSSDTEQ